MTLSKQLWAVILGGSSGLGLASAHRLAQDGFNLCLLHRTRKRDLPAFEEAIGQMEATGVQVRHFNQDALKSETIEHLSHELPERGVKVLLHSLAKGSLKPMRGSGSEALGSEDLAISLNAMGYSWYLWTSKFFREKRFCPDARNLAFTSEGNSKVWEGYGAISSAKAVLEALMRQMAVEFAPAGIRTNCIQAGVTQTPSFTMIPGSDKLAQMALKRNPMGRLTRPEDVAGVVSMLAGEDAGWINGAILKVDGGESLR